MPSALPPLQCPSAAPWAQDMDDPRTFTALQAMLETAACTVLGLTTLVHVGGAGTTCQKRWHGRARGMRVRRLARAAKHAGGAWFAGRRR